MQVNQVGFYICNYLLIADLDSLLALFGEKPFAIIIMHNIYCCNFDG